MISESPCEIPNCDAKYVHSLIAVVSDFSNPNFYDEIIGKLTIDESAFSDQTWFFALEMQWFAAFMIMCHIIPIELQEALPFSTFQQFLSHFSLIF